MSKVSKRKQNLINIILEISKLASKAPDDILHIFRKYPSRTGVYKKSEVLKAYKNLKGAEKIKLSQSREKNFLRLIQLKRTRTISGVTPVTVLTKPYPCPGKCIFCPSDVRMPKSYLSSEPGAQRASKNRFDPYQQTYNRLVAYNQIGHPTDKIELIVLGGTWSFYPKDYQIWFVKRCFDAMNDFNDSKPDKTVNISHKIPINNQLQNLSHTKSDRTYNQIVSKSLSKVKQTAQNEKSTWSELKLAQNHNESAHSRCVGLVIETRPDEITKEEVIRIRMLGATKIQLGFQSLNDKTLKLNKRGHDTNVIKNAVKLLRLAGFKIHAHYMPNLYGSNPKDDIRDYKKMFTDNSFRPDELKIYPCSLINGTELMRFYEKDLWRPYTHDELLFVLRECYKATPSYCRITRMIRDIGSYDIVAGNKKTNFRQIVEKSLKDENVKLNEIRAREIRSKNVSIDNLKLTVTSYQTSTSKEQFLQYVTENNRIVGFLRLSLPIEKEKHFINELKGSAIIREVHIYGPSIEIGTKKKGKAQHLGLGKALIEKAIKISQEKGYEKVSVISAVGTRKYYLKLGFQEDGLYQSVKI